MSPFPFLIGAEWAVATVASAIVQEEGAQPEAPSLVLDMPVSVDGLYVRDIAIGIGGDGAAFVREDQLRVVLADYAKPELFEALGLGDTDRLIALSSLAARGLDMQYDSGSLTVAVALSPADRLIRRLSLGHTEVGAPDDDVLPPASLSAGLNLTVIPSYVHSGEEPGLAPLRGRAEGFVNIGGFGGPVLAFDASYTEGRDDPVVLGDIVLFKDFFDKAIRVAGGTLRTPVTNRFSSSQNLIGVGVFRDYNQIRPFENLRPAGATSFVLERDALVTVLVNGAPVLTERFIAGTYDIDDLPLTAGGNDVTVKVEEDGLSQEAAVFSTYVDSTLLRGGYSRFGVHAGMLRGQGAALPAATDTFSTVIGYEQGLTDQVTVGGAVQTIDDTYQVSARGVLGTPIGIFAVETALQDDADGTSSSGAVRWTWQSDPSNRTSHQVDVQTLYEEEGFVPLRVAPVTLGPPDPRLVSMSMRYSLQSGPVNFNLTGQTAKTGAVTSVSTVIGGAYAFDQFTVSINARASWRDDPVGGQDHEAALLFSLNRRLGRRGRARVSYDTDRRTSEAQFLKLGTPFVGEWDGRLLISDDDQSERLDVEAGYVANRFEANVSHAMSRTGARQSAVTTGRAEIGFGFADGVAAWGRPFTSGFAIVSPHESLGDRRVTLTRGENLVEARTGALGPALQPLRNPYREEQTSISVDDLPVGYDLGPDVLEFFSPARAGYAYTVGKGASNTVMATLLKPDGSAMSLAIGELVRADGEDEPVGFFTNRTGRFVGEGLRAGIYNVLMKPDDRTVTQIEIPDDAEGLVRLGSVQMEKD